MMHLLPHQVVAPLLPCAFCEQLKIVVTIHSYKVKIWTVSRRGNFLFESSSFVLVTSDPLFFPLKYHLEILYATEGGSFHVGGELGESLNFVPHPNEIILFPFRENCFFSPL